MARIKCLKALLAIIFIIVFSIASFPKPTPIMSHHSTIAAVNSIYIYRAIKKVDIILTIFSSNSGDINIRNVYVQYNKNGRKHRLNIPRITVPYKWTYAPEEFRIIMNNDNSWDWGRPSKVSYITVELEHNGVIFAITNQSGQW